MFISLTFSSLLLSTTTTSTAPSICDQEIEIYGHTDKHFWEIKECIDNGPNDLKSSLRKIPEADLFFNEWCFIEEGWVICDEITPDTAHPWCDSDPFPQYCDGLCCIMTIIDCGCGGCMSGTFAYCK